MDKDQINSKVTFDNQNIKYFDVILMITNIKF